MNKQRFQGLGLAFPLGAVAAATAASLGCAPSAAAITPTVTEYTNGVTPGFSGADPEKIVRGPDGNLWFTNEEDPGRIMRITPAGVVTVVATGGSTSNFDANSKPAGITAGSDGNLWFTEFGDPGRIARITPGGAVTRMATGGVTSNFDANSRPSAITAGPGGNLWFVEQSNPGRLVRITPAGAVTRMATGGVTAGFTANTTPEEITAGPDGNLWFTGRSDPGFIERVSPGGVVSEYKGGTTSGFSANGTPEVIVTGPDGNLWFTESSDPGRIMRITPSGAVTEVATGGVTPGFTANADLYGIAAGPDGDLWFVEQGDPGRVGRITPAGAVTEVATGGVTPGFTANGSPNEITQGPDGNMWFTENSPPGRVVRITTPPGAATGAASVLGAGAARVRGALNGHAQPTSYEFQYGPTSAYGSASKSTGAGSGFTSVPASAKLTGLKPNSTYHYRLLATNPTGTTPGRDRTFKTLALPRVGHLTMSPKVWRPPVGTTIRFSLNRAVRIRLQFFAEKPGRKVNGKCRPPTQSNGGAQKCTRLVLAGTIVFDGHRGTNTVRFQGRISKKKSLSPGQYQLKVVAVDPTTPKTSSRSTGFTIVAG